MRLAIFVAGLLIVGMLAITPAPANTRSCPSMMLAAVRGSGEGPNDHSGFGKTLWSVYQHVHSAERSARATAIDYPAVSVQPVNYNYNLKYSDSVNRGENALTDFIATYLNSPCGQTTDLYLAGYSQGAEVVDGAFQHMLTANQKARIAGVVLFGDPRFNGRQGKPVDQGTYDASLSGVTRRQFHPSVGTFGTLVRFMPDEIAKVRSYCARRDPVCNDSGRGRLLGCFFGATVTSRCAHVHYMDHTFGRTTYTQAAASFLVARYRELGVPAVPCTGRLAVRLGAGDVTITLIQAKGVSCAEAKVAITQFEQDRQSGFHVGGQRFLCESHPIGDPGNTTDQTACTRGTHRLVTWRSEYAI